jgi:hypothetical protein
MKNLVLQSYLHEILLFGKNMMRGPDLPTIWNVGKRGLSIVVTNTLFSWSSWLFPFVPHLWALKTKVTFLLARSTLFSGPSALTLCLFFLFLKHILLRSISLFRLLFKSLFFQNLKKMVRSIIVQERRSFTGKSGCQRLKGLQQTSWSLITINHFDSHCYQFFDHLLYLV